MVQLIHFVVKCFFNVQLGEKRWAIHNHRSSSLNSTFVDSDDVCAGVGDALARVLVSESRSREWTFTISLWWFWFCFVLFLRRGVGQPFNDKDGGFWRDGAWASVWAKVFWDDRRSSFVKGGEKIWWCPNSKTCLKSIENITKIWSSCSNSDVMFSSDSFPDLHSSHCRDSFSIDCCLIVAAKSGEPNLLWMLCCNLVWCMWHYRYLLVMPRWAHSVLWFCSINNLQNLIYCWIRINGWIKMSKDFEHNMNHLR